MHFLCLASFAQHSICRLIPVTACGKGFSCCCVLFKCMNTPKFIHSLLHEYLFLVFGYYEYSARDILLYYVSLASVLCTSAGYRSR